MKTDAKIMAEIWREIENNPDAEIEYFSTCAKWYTKSDFVFDPYSTWYRIKPKTIIVNGVEIPKPLDACDIKIKDDNIFYMPSCLERGWESFSLGYYNNYRPAIVYFTKEEAIEASKKLFGIE